MTSLPIHIPSGFEILVKKDDEISVNQVLAQKLSETKEEESVISDQPITEIPIDVPSFFGVSVEKSRTLVRKNPGDTVRVGDILASKSSVLGTKKEDLVSQIGGTVLRFERDSGHLIIRAEGIVKMPSLETKNIEPETIVSPLAGKVTLCNNDQIVIESKINALTGVSGTGGKVQGELSGLLFHKDAETEVISSHLTASAIGKILVVSEIGREALAKGAAIGVLGIIASHITNDDVSYVGSHFPEFPIVEVDNDIAVKLAKASGKIVVLDGFNKIIMISE